MRTTEHFTYFIYLFFVGGKWVGYIDWGGRRVAFCGHPTYFPSTYLTPPINYIITANSGMEALNEVSYIIAY